MSKLTGGRYFGLAAGSGAFSRTLKTIVVLLLIAGGLQALTDAPVGPVSAEEGTRMVNGERGSVQDVDLDAGELTNLMIGDGDALVLSEAEHQVDEEFDGFDGVERYENLIETTSGSEVQHFFRNTYGSSGAETVESCIAVSNGGYVLTGNVYTPSTLYNMLLMKIDRNGNHLWTRSFGGVRWDYGYDVLETTGGNFVIVGTTNSFGKGDDDVWLVMTDKMGIEIWNYTYDIDGNDRGLSIMQLKGGEFVICGGQQDQKSTDMLLMMVDLDGKERWNATFGDDTEQIGRDVIQTSDGNLMVIGDSEPFNGMESATIWKVSTTGKEVWNMTYSGSISRQWTYGYRVAELQGGDLILFGLKETMPGSGQEFLLMRTASSGKAIWTQTYTASGNTRSYSMTVNLTGVTMAGSTYSSSARDEAYIVRADLNGNKKWDATYGGLDTDVGVEILPSPYGLYLFGHSISWGPGSQGVFLLNLTDDGGGSRGLYVSKNILGGIYVSGLKELLYKADIPTGTSIKIRFSLDMVHWLDNSGNQGRYVTISGGSGRVSLSNFPMVGGDLYFELTFNCNQGDGASIDSLTLKYLTMFPDGQFVSLPFDGGEGVRWGRIWYEWGGPEGTSVSAKTRTGDTLEDLSSKPFTGPDGTEITSYGSHRPITPSEGGGRLLQIFLNLTTGLPSISPTVLNLNFTYDRPGEINSSSVTYDTGDIDDDLYFSLIFMDPDDDLPDVAKVEIDGTNITMLSSEGDTITSDGKEYYYSTKLEAGSHMYRFFVEYWDVVLSTEMETMEVKAGPLRSMVIDPQEITVTADETAHFTVSGYDRMGDPADFVPTWEVEGGGTMDENGNFTADKVGTWVVKVSSGVIMAFANVTVTPGAMVRIEVATEAYVATTDDMVQLTAVGFDSDDNEIDIEPVWEAEGGGTVDQTGLFDPVSPGLWRIYANLSDISGSEVIEVDVGALHHIIIEPAEAALNITRTQQFTASGYDADGNQVFLDPHWEVSGGGSIHTSGIFTAETPGTWTVSCTSGTISANATVIVNQLPSGDDDDDTGADDDDTSSGGGVSPVIIAVLIAAVLIILAGVVLVFLLIRKGKKGEVTPEVPEQTPETAPQGMYGEYPEVQAGQVPQDDTAMTSPQYMPETYGYPPAEPVYQPAEGTYQEQVPVTEAVPEIAEGTGEEGDQSGLSPSSTE